MTEAAAPGQRQYVFLPGGSLTVADATQTYRVRFTRNNGYTVQTPYGVPPSDPWYMRIGFNLRPVAQEWPVQPFVPKMPYLLARWVPGTILSKILIEFERKPVWFDPTVGQYPDVLVYDKNYQIKYALDGLPPNLKRPPDKGWLFPWRTSQILDMDALHARVQVNVDLAPDDIAYGFYSYLEPDVLFMTLDVNPFSNPALKDKVIEFYYADRGRDFPPQP